MPSDPTYVSPFAAQGGTINTMERWKKMNQQVPPASPTPMTPAAPPPAQPQPQQGFLQGMLGALRNYFQPPQQTQPPQPQSVDSLLQSMRELNQRASQIQR